jgi:hypothetical protein
VQELQRAAAEHGPFAEGVNVTEVEVRIWVDGKEVDLSPLVKGVLEKAVKKRKNEGPLPRKE